MNLLFIALAIGIGMVVFILAGTQAISHLVDQKIGNIEVRVPQLKLPRPREHKVVFKVKKDAEGTVLIQPAGSGEKRRKCGKKKAKQLDHRNKIQLHEPFLSVRFDEAKKPSKDDVNDDIQDELMEAPIVVETKEPPTHPRVVIGCRTDADCNVVHGDGKNVCKSDGTCSCVGGGSGTFCHFGPVNYRDPRDMTKEERRRFKAKFRSDYTLQDYKNWLMLYRDDPENLRENHRRNLKVLLRGGQLEPKDIPSMRVRPPTDAADYFQRLYKGGNIAVHFSEDGPYVGSNYGQFDEFVPPENVSNSWITGNANLYREGKDDARALDWYMRPELSTGTEEQRAGDIYQRYVEKHHNLSDIREVLSRTTRPTPIETRESLLNWSISNT